MAWYNYAAVRKAVDLIIQTNIANRTYTPFHTIYEQAYSWYDETDYTDPELLAACVLQYGHYAPGDTYKMAQYALAFWFPYCYEPEEFSIYEF